MKKKVATCFNMSSVWKKKLHHVVTSHQTFVDMSSKFVDMLKHVDRFWSDLIRLDVRFRPDSTKPWKPGQNLGVRPEKTLTFWVTKFWHFFKFWSKKKHKKNLINLVSMGNRILGEYFFHDWNPENPSFCGKWCSFGPKNVKNVPVHLFFFKHLPQPKKSTLKKAA